MFDCFLNCFYVGHGVKVQFQLLLCVYEAVPTPLFDWSWDLNGFFEINCLRFFIQYILIISTHLLTNPSLFHTLVSAVDGDWHRDPY